MALSRRAFVRTLTSGKRPAEPVIPPASPPAPRVSPTVAARGREAGDATPLPAALASAVYLASTESVMGPGPLASAALLAHYASDPTVTPKARLREADLRAAVAEGHSASITTVVTGAGATELLRNATRAFTSASAPLVIASPSFGVCAAAAGQLGTPVIAIPVAADGGIDLDAVARAATGAGLVYLCNPNNPTGTVHRAAAVQEFAERIRSASPSTSIVVDEAYHDYVTDPGYASAIPLALVTPRMLVVRSFSKAHGLAGLRIGYAVGVPDTMKTLARHVMPNGTNVMAIGPAIAALRDGDYLAGERTRNAAARAFTSEALTTLGCVVASSHANFVFARVGMAARAFREACAERGVIVGRDFPPLADAWARISVGTMDDMRRAVDVFDMVLTSHHRHSSGGAR